MKHFSVLFFGAAEAVLLFVLWVRLSIGEVCTLLLSGEKRLSTHSAVSCKDRGDRTKFILRKKRKAESSSANT